MRCRRFPRFYRAFVAGLGLFVAAVASLSAADGVVIDSLWPGLPEFKFKQGDDPRWAQPGFDDRDWRVSNLRDLPSRDGIYWVRFKMTRRQAIDPELRNGGIVAGALPAPGFLFTLRLTLRKWASFNPETLRDGFAISAVASYDLYWDGQLIGRNGRPGATPADEQAGYVDNLFQIPIELTKPGEHTVALRLSSQETGFKNSTYSLNFIMGNFRDLLVTRTRQALLSVVAFGGALVVSLVAGLGWLLAGRRRSLLLMSASCAVAATMQALQAWRWLFEYSYPWHFPRLVAITLLTGALGFLLVAFLHDFFAIQRRAWQMLLLLGLMVAAWFSSPIYNAKSLAMSVDAFVMATAISGWAVIHRRRGARFILVGMLASMFMFVSPREFLESTFLFSFGAPMTGCLIALTLQLNDERRAARQATLTAARLETELLRKQLQPHFVLNTLTALSEVVEQDPKGAVQLIEALAEEFRALARMSGEKLVSLGEELSLCQTHLTVMSLRHDARHILATEGTNDNAAVPPAVFLTLLENGLTHQRARRGVGARENIFRLRAATLPDTGGIRYEFFSPGEPTRRAGEPETGHREGTGMRYIRARLEESFPGRWSLVDGPVEGGWQTVIELIMEDPE